MGLLDGNLDPQSASVLALAGGLLSPGSFGQGLSRGIAGQQAVLASAQEQELRRQQIASAQQEAQMRDLQMQRTRQQLQFGQSFLGDMGASSPAMPSSMPAASSAMGQGASMGSVGPTIDNAARMSAQPVTVTPQQQSRLASLSQDQIAAGVVSGVIPKEFVELWTNAKFGRALPPGWKQNLDGSMIYVPDPTKGVTMGPDGKTVQAMPGAADTLGALAGATKAGELDATNARTPVPLDRLDRMPGLSPFATVGDLISPPAAVARGAANPVQAANTSSDMRRLGTPASINGAPAGGPIYKTPDVLAAEKVEAENAAKLRTEPAVKYANDTATSAAKEKDELDTRVRTGQDLMMRINESRAALDQFKPGMGADSRLQVARLAQAVGAPDDLVKRINGGDVAAKQEFIKLSAQTAMESLKQAMGGSGRITQAEFAVFQKNNPIIELDPDAIKKIQAFATKVYQRDFAEQQARRSYLENGGSPAQWSATWAKTLDPSGGGTPGATPLPANPTASSLKKGTAYVLPNGKTAVWDGFKFKGD